MSDENLPGDYSNELESVVSQVASAAVQDLFKDEEEDEKAVVNLGHESHRMAEDPEESAQPEETSMDANDALAQLVSSTMAMLNSDESSDEENGSEEPQVEEMDLSKAIEDAVQEKFAGAQEEQETGQGAELHLAEETLSKEIENALRETEALKSGEESQDNEAVLAAALRSAEKREDLAESGEVAELELSKAIEEALKTPIDEEDGDNDGDEDEEENNELKAALAQVAQSVVETNLTSSSSDSDSDSEKDKRTDDQWESIIQKAMEMVDTRTVEPKSASTVSSTPAETPAEKQTLSSLAESVASAAESTATMKDVVQQRLEELSDSKGLSMDEMLTAYKQYVSGDKKKAKGELVTFAKDDPKRLSIPQMLALERQKMSAATSGETGADWPDLNPSSVQKTLLDVMLSHLDLEKVGVMSVVSSVRSETASVVEDILDGTIDKIVETPSGDQKNLGDVDERTRRRIENRQRKKKWRETNVERNRDNDLRLRVLKRAQILYPRPEQEAKRSGWVAQEFGKRRQKRLLRENQHQEELLGLPKEGQLSPATVTFSDVIANNNLLGRVVAAYSGLHYGDVSVETLVNPKSSRAEAVKALVTILIFTYLSEGPRFNLTKLPVIIGSMVTSVNSFYDHAEDTKSDALAKPSPLLTLTPPGLDIQSTQPPSPPSPPSPPPPQKSPEPVRIAPAVETFRMPSLAESRQPKKAGRKKGKSAPVDYKKFLSPHPPPPSFWIKLKEKQSGRKRVGETYPPAKRQATAHTQSAPLTQRQAIIPITRETKLSALVEQKKEKLASPSSLGSLEVSFPSTAPESGVTKPRYIRPGQKPVKSASPVVLRRPSAVPKKPSYYGIRKPAPFKSPDGSARISRPIRGIVPLKPINH